MAASPAGRALRDWSLWLLDARAATDADWPVRASAQRLRSYAFGGGMGQIGLGMHDGQLPWPSTKLINGLVALFEGGSGPPRRPHRTPSANGRP